MVSIYDWEWFMQQFGMMSKIDLTAYKRPQMERRINSFMRSNGADGYGSFISMLEADQALYRKFIEHLTINVSEFFRNQVHWEILENQVIPELLSERSTLKIWSAGCSTGEEPYSLAMLMKERFQSRSDKILATDIDQDVLDKASQAIYTGKAADTLPSYYGRKYLVKEGEHYRLSDDIKRMVTFKQHDLLRDAYPRQNDLILCRNVVIYFTEETKNRLYQKFVDALRPGGVLFIGSTEQIFQARELGLRSVATFFYQKV